MEYMFQRDDSVAIEHPAESFIRRGSFWYIDG